MENICSEYSPTENPLWTLIQVCVQKTYAAHCTFCNDNCFTRHTSRYFLLSIPGNKVLHFWALCEIIITFRLTRKLISWCFNAIKWERAQWKYSFELRNNSRKVGCCQFAIPLRFNPIFFEKFIFIQFRRFPSEYRLAYPLLVESKFSFWIIRNGKWK